MSENKLMPENNLRRTFSTPIVERFNVHKVKSPINDDFEVGSKKKPHFRLTQMWNTKGQEIWHRLTNAMNDIIERIPKKFKNPMFSAGN